MRKALKLFGGSPREVDALVFNDLLRRAGQHSLLDAAAVERWLKYRANRNNTAHDYGAGFAEETLKILPAYLVDVHDWALLPDGFRQNIQKRLVQLQLAA